MSYMVQILQPLKILVDEAIKALYNSAPFESNDILIDKNEFSIDIIYKLQ